MNPNQAYREIELMNQNKIIGISSRVLYEAFDQGKSPRMNCIERSGKHNLKLKYLQRSHARIFRKF
jgi:hypothetical protein